MKIILTLIASVSIASAQQVAQTSAQIQQQKETANQPVISGVADNFKTPLKMFELYFAGIAAGDSREFQCLTKKAIKDWLEVDELTPADLKRMSDGHKSLDPKDFVLVEFRFKADANHPEIIYSYRWNQKDGEGKRITIVEREKLVLTKTKEGWKIDSVEPDPKS